MSLDRQIKGVSLDRTFVNPGVASLSSTPPVTPDPNTNNSGGFDWGSLLGEVIRATPDALDVFFGNDNGGQSNSSQGNDNPDQDYTMIWVGGGLLLFLLLVLVIVLIK